jgi:hypothetical protein
LDIENLNQGSADDYSKPTSLWHRVVGINTADLAVIGADVTGAIAAKAALPHAGLVAGRGESGADRALVARGRANLSTHRFNTLIIGSGDHEFSDLAREARSNGLYVLVVCNRGSLSTELRRAASRVQWLPLEPIAEDGALA